MSVTIEIRQPEPKQELTVAQIAALDNLQFGTSDGNYCLERGETGLHNILYTDGPIGRGVELTIDKGDIFLRLPLPNTPHDIAMCYRLAEKICNHLGLPSFVREDEEIPVGQSASLVTIDLQASVNALRNMEQQVRSGEQTSMGVFAAYNPILLGPEEMDEIGGTLDGFEQLLNARQAMDVYYAIPRFYRLENGPVIGLYFIAEDAAVVLPHEPKPPYYTVDGVGGYYVRIPGQNDIPYALFLEHAPRLGRYDAAREIFRLNANEIRTMAEQYAADVTTGEHLSGTYWGRAYDHGFDHVRKIRDLELPLDELAGWNHLAVFLRWCCAHDLLSERLLTEMPGLPHMAQDPAYDLRDIIANTPAFRGGLRAMHFNSIGKAFADFFYRFNDSDGFPACIDAYAEAVLGSEKYHCDEYKNEAYLFVPWGEDYYTGLSAYIDKAWERFCTR